MSIEQTVIELIAKEAKMSPADVLPSARIRELGVDSLSTVHVILALEDELKIRIHDDSVGDIKTVQDIINLCTRLRS